MKLHVSDMYKSKNINIGFMFYSFQGERVFAHFLPTSPPPAARGGSELYYCASAEHVWSSSHGLERGTNTCYN